MNVGKEEGFSAGHAAGKIAGAIEGQEEFLKSEDFAARIREARFQGARDFMKAPAFECALEIKAADFLMQAFERCKAQVATLVDLLLTSIPPNWILALMATFNRFLIKTFLRQKKKMNLLLY
ncbi:UNVERIFIED_CONTAM: hypothetical protein Sindi_1675200 [Sesamum indicum]